MRKKGRLQGGEGRKGRRGGGGGAVPLGCTVTGVFLGGFTTLMRVSTEDSMVYMINNDKFF